MAVPVAETSGGQQRPTIEDLTGSNHFAQLARQYWLGKARVKKVQASVIKDELWAHLEKSGFQFSDLLLLEQLQLLDRYLWPGYTEGASDHHVALLAVIVNVKRQEGVPAWGAFSSHPDHFSSFFRRALQMSIDDSLALNIRTYLVQFIVGAFQSLDVGIIRKECAALVSIGIWHNLHSESYTQGILGQAVQLGKAWRASMKRYDAADENTQGRLAFERSWLARLTSNFLERIYLTDQIRHSETVVYCERVLELLTDLLSQLPTRRYVGTLLRDMNLLPVVTLSPLYAEEQNVLLRDMVVLLRHFLAFPIDNYTGKELSPAESEDRHNSTLAKLQKIAMRDYKDKLTILALSNLKSLGTREDLESHLASMSDEELKQLGDRLDLRTDYPAESAIVRDRQFYLEIVLAIHERAPSFRSSVHDTTVLPTEDSVYETAFERTSDYNGSRPLAIPKLNLQYLTVSDFLWRSFILYRSESFYAIRNHIEDTVKRIKPRPRSSPVRFDGFSRMAIPITKPAIISVELARVGADYPSLVHGEVTLDMKKFTPGVRREWESLRPDDVIYLVAVQPLSETTNGTSRTAEVSRPIKYLRCAEIAQVLDESGRPLRDRQEVQMNGHSSRRKLLLRLDPVAYHTDKKRSDTGKGDIYESINLLVRRRGRENNFKPILESIQHLVLSEAPLPNWLQEVFLGYSDPAAASYERLPNRMYAINYLDTFLDWGHLVESFPGKVVEPEEEAKASFPPPYILEHTTTEVATSRPTKRRKKDKGDVPTTKIVESLKVSTYDPPNTGPYPSDELRTNVVRFTPTQVEAITSGTQPGLTLVIGPPGTGKTDVATQIVSNIYHIFPEQKTLLIAHSNQALNQLFQKITALDIDERHLLRLGHGEEELETEADYSKAGRIESLMERSAQYLAEVGRLAASIHAPGAHGSSCETAEYFDQVYVRPAWSKFLAFTKTTDDATAIANAFPFRAFFANAPKLVFPPDATRDEVMHAAEGCNNHLRHLFETLSSTRPFELLRNQRDKASYLLLHSARIVAMTSTHAAMRRSEIAQLGFHYDNIVMEESAQITEIETFIPLALQKPQNGDMPLKRVILVGDHLQNSPIVQNEAFRAYANLEQSLFKRLVRLGVPTIQLDAQARARPSIAKLYSWRYPKLTDLPLVTTANEFISANAGFRYPYQFVDVPAYKGRGEHSPNPHFVQNLGEAEYAVAIYQYMRLLGYPASKISILSMYAGQKALIRDVLTHRCKSNPLFGMPRAVSTVDRYQGEQNDYIILSLVRTERIGYMRDLRRLTVALSRARLGLYVLGRRELFESSLELQPVFERLFRDGQNNGDKLALVTGEVHPTTRGVDDAAVDSEEGKVVAMQGVEHLGQYVFEMTKAKVEDLKKGTAQLPPAEDVVLVGESSDDGEGVVEFDGEDASEAGDE